MDNTNFISTIKLDLNFFSEIKNKEFQDNISDLFNSKISFEIDQLFSSVSKNAIRKYDVIELDIGEIAYSQLNSELPSKIITALSDKLFFNSGTRIPELDDSINYHYYFQTLEQFIKTGELSNHSHKNYHTVNNLLSIVLAHNSDEFIKLLFSIGEKENIRKRIVYQFEISSTLKIIEALEPQKFDTIKSYLSSIKSIQHKEKVVQTQEHEFERANLLFVLTYILNKRGSVFNTKNFIRSQIKQMAGHYNMGYNDLLLLMFQSAKKTIVSGSDIKIVDFIRTIFAEDFLSNEEMKSISNKYEVEELIEDTSKLKRIILHNAIIYFLENGIWPEKHANIEVSEIQIEFAKMVRYEKGIIEKILKPNLIINRAKRILSISTNDTYEYILKSLNYNSYNLVEEILKLPFDREFKSFNNSEIIKEAVLYSLVINKSIASSNTKISEEILNYLKQKSNFDFPLFIDEVKKIDVHFFSNPLTRDFANIVLQDKGDVIGILQREKLITKREKQDIISVLWNEFKLQHSVFENTLTQNEFQSYFTTISDSLTKKEYISEVIKVYNSVFNKTSNFKELNNIELYNKNFSLSEFEAILTKSDYSRKNRFTLIKEYIKKGKLPWWFKNDRIDQLKLIAKQVFQEEEGIWMIDIFRSTHDKKKIVNTLKKLFTEQDFYNKFIFGANFNSTIFKNDIQFVANKIPNDIKIDIEYLAIAFYAYKTNENLSQTLKKVLNNVSDRKYYWEFINHITEKNKKTIHSTFLSWLIQNLVDTDLSNNKYQHLNSFLDINKNFDENLEQDFINIKANSNNLSKKKNLFLEFINEINVNAAKAEVLLDDLLIQKNANSKEEVEYRLFLINAIKNEKIKSTIFNNISIVGIQKIISTLFQYKYNVLKPMIYDLEVLIKELTVFDNSKKTSVWLYLGTINFLINNEHNQIRLSNYVENILKKIRVENNKISKHKIESAIASMYSTNKLNTFLPFITKEIERIDKVKKEKKKKAIEDKNEEEKDLTDYIFVDNAGIVLLWPFFEHLFKMFNLLEDGKLISIEKKERAIYLLHYIVMGQEEAFEYELTFEKILCNFPRNYATITSFEIEEREKEIIKSLIETAINRWSVLGETSIEGFRESFLKRKGKVVIMEGEEIVLYVEKKSYDMLIDRLPWSIATIRLPWLEKQITVNWR